jgi:flagellar hook-associated protein 1 FlgK
MTTGLLSIGSSALNAAYTALRTTGNNIANVNTPGYSREVTSFTPQIQTNNGSNYLGTGVAVADVSRVYSDFLAAQTNLAQAQASGANTMAQLTGQINSLFSNSSTGLGSAIDTFFTQVQMLASQPGSAATRQTVLSSAQQMASQFNDVQGQLQLMGQGTDAQIGQQISSVNSTVTQIADLNSQISLASASGATPNSLLDQRNQDILTLNQSVGVTTTTQTDGSMNVFLANGQPLVVGNKTFAMSMGQDPQNPGGIIVGTTAGGSIAALDPANTGGGAIGSLLQFRSQTLPSLENQIGRLAVMLSSQFNAIQTQGQDGNGATGAAVSNFFSTPAINVVAASANADAATVTVSAGYDTPNINNLQASDYRLTVMSPGNYSVTRLSDNTTTSYTALPIKVDGMSLTFATPPATGDVFSIQPVHLGATNISVAITQGSQIAAASPIQAKPGGANTGSLTIGNLALQPLPANPNAALTTAVALSFTSPAQFTANASVTVGTTTYAAGAAVPYVAGQPVMANGWSLTLNGAPATGDVVNVAPGAVGSSDNRNALLMGQLQSQAFVSGSTLDAAYSAVVANVGAIASTAQIDQTSKDAILTNATAAQSSVSGVNLDEEASKMMQFQQQYQAAAKLIQTATNVFDAILAVAGAA